MGKQNNRQGSVLSGTGLLLTKLLHLFSTAKTQREYNIRANKEKETLNECY